MSALQKRLIPDEIDYTGEQLRSHWAYRSFDIAGDSIVAFIGRCDVQPRYMKDVEDLNRSARIFSERMLHFIVEYFEADLDRGVLRQHLIMACMAEVLNRRLNAGGIRREGSDLFDGDFKLTVSVASVSPVSTLIHAGINCSSRNTPVPTRGLDDYGIDARDFAHEVLQSYAREHKILYAARCKVRGCE